jgi:hypothetical protein
MQGGWAANFYGFSKTMRSLQSCQRIKQAE